MPVSREQITAVAEADVDRTSAAGKASSVQFVHFPFTGAQIEVFKQSHTRITVGINHTNDGHLAVLTEAMRQVLAKDFI